MSAPKLCINCKHFEGGWKCRSPKNNVADGIDLVTGEDRYISRYMDANAQRSEGRIISFLEMKCGKRGRWFESK